MKALTSKIPLWPKIISNSIFKSIRMNKTFRNNLTRKTFRNNLTRKEHNVYSENSTTLVGEIKRFLNQRKDAEFMSQRHSIVEMARYAILMNRFSARHGGTRLKSQHKGGRGC